MSITSSRARALGAAWRHPLTGYPAALVGEAGAVALTVDLRPHWPYPSLLLVAVIVAVALSWGLGPSVLATVLAAVLGHVFLLPPYHDWLGTDGLLLVGLCISLLCHRAQRARRQAEEAVRLREQVLTLATHGLRTPLTLALGHAQLLRADLRGGNPARLDRDAAALVAALWRMSEQVDEVADAAHLQIGQPLALRRSEVDLCALVAHVAQAHSLGGPVHVHCPPAPVMVVGDRARLERVVDNLIANARKYSGPGMPVEVSVGYLPAQQAVLSVRDQRIGMPQKELRRIFQPFYRASTAAACDW